MKWILIFLVSIQGFVSFGSQAEIVDKSPHLFQCKYYNHAWLQPTVADKNSCLGFAYLISDFDTHCGSNPNVRLSGDFVLCNVNNTVVQIYPYSGLDSSCPTSHQFETSSGQCSDEIIDIIPDDPLPEKQENGCYPSGTVIDNIHAPSYIENKSSCFSDSCSATIRPTDGMSICFDNDDGIKHCDFSLVSSGQSCTFNPSNPQWTDEIPLEPQGDYTPSNDLSGGGLDSGAIDSNGNPVSGAESTNTFEQQITNENLKRLIDDQATLLTDINKSLNSSIDYDKVKTGYLKQISENTKNISSGGGGGGSSSGDGGDWSGSGDSIASDSCDSFACSSHPVICQIAKEAWLKRCEVDDFLGPGGAASEISDGLQNFIDENPNDLLEAGEFNVSNVMNKYTDGSGLSTSATCPSPKNIDIHIASFEIDYTPFCDMAVIIRALIIIFSSVASVLLISKYM